jgi:hypothetical protein
MHSHFLVLLGAVNEYLTTVEPSTTLQATSSPLPVGKSSGVGGAANGATGVDYHWSSFVVLHYITCKICESIRW